MDGRRAAGQPGHGSVRTGCSARKRQGAIAASKPRTGTPGVCGLVVIWYAPRMEPAGPAPPAAHQRRARAALRPHTGGQVGAPGSVTRLWYWKQSLCRSVGVQPTTPARPGARSGPRRAPRGAARAGGGRAPGAPRATSTTVAPSSFLKTRRRLTSCSFSFLRRRPRGARGAAARAGQPGFRVGPSAPGVLDAAAVHVVVPLRGHALSARGRPARSHVRARRRAAHVGVPALERGRALHAAALRGRVAAAALQQQLLRQHAQRRERLRGRRVSGRGAAGRRPPGAGPQRRAPGRAGGPARRRRPWPRPQSCCGSAASAPAA
jgi:hypothetical protein